MSSKKALRKKQREKAKADSRKGVNPALLFVVGVGFALLVTVAVSMMWGESSAPGDPPWPGAVWSDAHGHWH